MYPERCRSLVPIATTVSATAQQIAYSSVQRNAIALDPNWRGGDYYDAPDGEGPHRGLALARSLAQVTYRSDEVFNERFGRQVVETDEFDLWQRFSVEGYLDYHGLKLVRRFDANSYLRIAKAMDLHDVGRDRGGVESAMSRIRCPVRTMSIDSDALYPPYQQRLICDVLSWLGTPADDVTIESPHGHDAFLIETDQVGAALRELLEKVEADDG
jgi:homoserine O-acetyltransferase